MRTVVAELESVSPYSQSKKIGSPRLDKESAADHENRCWRERAHVDEKDRVFIPPMAFKNCLSEAAKFLSVQMPGKGKSTYTKHFEAGILITDPIFLPVKKSQIEGEWIFVPANGRRGSGTRVDKCFPLFKSWKGELTIYILDDTITAEVLKYHLEQAGAFIGIGRFRPRNNGFYGRFKVVDMIWQDGK